MIWAFHKNRAKTFSGNNDGDFFQHIVRLENAKLFEDHPEFGQGFWSFIIHSPSRVAMVYRHISLQQQSPVLKRAYEQSLGFVEICRGDYTSLEEILLTDRIDLAALKKQWCRDYCEAHGYTVTEINLPRAQAHAAPAGTCPAPASLTLH